MRRKPIEHIVSQIHDRHQTAVIHAFKSAYRLFRDKQRAVEVARDRLIDDRPDLDLEEAGAAVKVILSWNGIDP